MRSLYWRGYHATSAALAGLVLSSGTVLPGVTRGAAIVYRGGEAAGTLLRLGPRLFCYLPRSLLGHARY